MSLVDKLSADALALVATVLPLRWNDPDANTIADLELARVLDELSEIADPVEQREAIRFVLMALSWHAASATWAASDRLQRAAPHLERDSVAWALIDAVSESFKLKLGEF